MCKLAIMPKVKPGKQKLALQLAKELAPHMTARDNDGFGYMALGDKGIFGERWLDVEQAFRPSKPISPDIQNVLSDYLGALESDALTGYNSFGVKTDNFTCLALHSRMATCGVSLENVHPFVAVDGKSGIVHNGVISNSYKFKNTLSTCDSEALLINYNEYDIVHKSPNIQKLAEAVSGWYAFAAIAQDSKGDWYLDIVKDDKAKLMAAYIPKLEAVVFCTEEDILRKACRALKWAMGPVLEVLEGMLIRHYALTGDVTEVYEFDVENDNVVPARFLESAYNREAEVTDDGRVVENEDDGPVDTVEYMKNPFYYSGGR